jgi:hypothetical protein
MTDNIIGNAETLSSLLRELQSGERCVKYMKSLRVSTMRWLIRRNSDACFGSRSRGELCMAGLNRDAMDDRLFVFSGGCKVKSAPQFSAPLLSERRRRFAKIKGDAARSFTTHRKRYRTLVNGVD